MVRYCLLIIRVLLCVSVVTTTTASYAKKGCSDSCGNITVPYPFGFGDAKCSLDSWFNLTCWNSSELFFRNNFPIDHISLEGPLTVSLSAYYKCDQRNAVSISFGGRTNLERSLFTFSYTRNKFTVIGCNSLAFVSDNEGNMLNGCLSYCDNPYSAINGSCGGLGCCQTSIPMNLKKLNFTFTTIRDTTTMPSIFNDTLCSLAFLADQEWFNFSKSLLSVKDYSLTGIIIPVALDWVVGNTSCQQASTNVCGINSNCTNSEFNNSGYRCYCKEGYTGNPYLPQGCQDIDECLNQSTLPNPCVTNSICLNTPGSYTCSCPLGSYGDGRTNGTGCIAQPRGYKVVPILGNSRPNTYCNKIFDFGDSQHHMFAFDVVSLSVLIVFLLWCCYLLILELKKRKLIKRKQDFFKRNGGLLLEEKMSSNEVGILKSKIFTEEELEKATDNYNKNRILGTGGAGTVYKGMLQDGGIVAIKKSKTMEEYQIDQFVNEVSLLSQIVHRHVVRLVGCCLEAEVPLLVYEFVSNGTLYDHIHSSMSYMSWEDRLRIATEVASAIAYLHSSASTPILHRDIKSGNILLDENYKAKLADFGISRSIPDESTHLTASLLQGTPGYMDPEFLETGQYTEKSDVYSFGVVLVEMLVGQKPVSNFRSDEERYLRQYFILSMKANRLFQILNDRMVNEGKEEELIKFAVLARRCLKSKSKKRPTMKEVASLLDELRRSHDSPSKTNIKAKPGNEGSIVNAFDVEFGASFSESSYQEKKGFPQISTI